MKRRATKKPPFKVGASRRLIGRAARAPERYSTAFAAADVALLGWLTRTLRCQVANARSSRHCAAWWCCSANVVSLDVVRSSAL
jgi:hypothetical protein